MRNIAEIRTNLFNKSLESIKIDLHCRDEIPTILLGLQELYRHPEVLGKILNHLDGLFPPEICRNRGRPGLNLWQILVLGVIRLASNCDYDKLSDLAGNHQTIRLFLHEGEESDKRYPHQTLADNISRFTPDMLELVNNEIIKLGHSFTASSGPTESRIDSFVVETDVHFPTDLSLIWDGARTIIRLTVNSAEEFGVSGWREWKSIKQKIRKKYRTCQLVRKGKPKKEATKVKKHAEEIRTVRNYQDAVVSMISKVKNTVSELSEIAHTGSTIEEIEYFIEQTELVMNQLVRRIVNDKKIPHAEKIFSMFEPHTEWISKGKAGVSQELGVRVAVAEDELGFLISWRTMFRETDEKVTVSMTENVLNTFPTVEMFSFDKGFYSPENSKKLAQLCKTPILPKKGKLTSQQKADTEKPEYIKFRHKHSRIESAIHAIENHGLDRCPDHGKNGFERYIGLAVVARNILQIGRLVKEKRLKSTRKLRIAK